MPQIQVYPRFYTSRSPNGSGLVMSKGDATVVTLNGFLYDRTANINGWQYRREVIESALRLFGDFTDWMRDQLNNPAVVGYNLEFIKDTMQFIRTGHRDLCLANWIELVAENDDLAAAAQVSRLKLADVGLKHDETTVQLIQKWVSQPNGLYDLIGTLNILFGQARGPRG
jgi:hypothetical protein